MFCRFSKIDYLCRRNTLLNTNIMKKKLSIVAMAFLLGSLCWAFYAGAPEVQGEQVDMTERIVNPDFNEGKTGWSGNWGNGALKATAVNPLITSNNSTFDVYQDIEDLPNGRYLLKAQAFTRPMTHNDLKTAWANGETLENKTYLYANEECILVKLITEETNTDSSCGDEIAEGKRIPNNSTQAANAFNAGMYDNELLFVVNGGKVRIGIRQESENGTTYVGYDHFRLIYLGEVESVSDEMKSEILASIPEGEMNAGVKAALDKAVADFQTESSVANYNALGTAIEEAKISIKTYKDVREALLKAEQTTLSEEARKMFNNDVQEIVNALEEHALSGNGEEPVAAIEAALEAAIKADAAQSPDKTSLIKNPNFDTQDTSGWSGDFGTGAVKAKDINPLITAYGGTFDIYQDISGLENGTYRLQVQAFSRPMDHNDLKTAVNQGKALNNETYFYGNSQEKLVKLITEEYATSNAWGAELAVGKYIPNSSSDAAKAFNAGMYENELLCIVTDGTLRIGLRQEATTGTPYIGYDNFRLTYVSESTELPEEKTALTVDAVRDYISRCQGVASQAVEHVAFDERVEEAEKALSAEAITEEELQGIKDNLTGALAALLKKGETASGQFDLTQLIVNATFDDKLEGWCTARPFVWHSTGLVQASDAQRGGSLWQTLKGMPAGKYTLKVQGFHRQSGWKEGLYEYEHGHRIDGLSLCLNDTEKKMKSIFEDGRSMLASENISRTEDVGSTIDGRGFPHLVSKVGDIFTPGHYWNYVEAEVPEDGEVKIGVRLAETDREDNWAVVDNFRLYYGERKPIIVKNNMPSVQDDTPADVKIAKKFTAGVVTPFCAPCDIPGTLFTAVYGIGALNYAGSKSTMTLYPVENVHAGVPCCVVTSEDIDTLEVRQTIIRVAKSDKMQLPWKGGLIAPVDASLSWSHTGMDGKSHSASVFKNIEYVNLDDMDFTASIENYQIQRFLALNYTQSSSSQVSEYNQPAPARRDMAHSVGIPIPESKAEGTVVRYSLNEDMGEAESIANVYGHTLCYIPNLVPGQKYFYEVVQDEKTVSRGQFKVEGGLRQLYAPSIYNMRDFGGWTMQDGRVTRYGLLYRGGEVNGYHAPYPKDVETLKELGIGAEIDLRYNDSYDQDRETGKSGFGFVKGDNYFFAGANDYTADNLKEAATQNRLKEEFRFMMKHLRQGTGVYFHCVFGADRTGFFAMLLQGLLGFTLNDMYHDYEITSFAAPAGNRNKNAIQERIAVIQALSGKTLRDKYENYWVNSVGITQEEVEEFRNIMLLDLQADAVEEVLQPCHNRQKTISNVYNLQGMKVQRDIVPEIFGIYVIQYNDGTTRRISVK